MTGALPIHSVRVERLEDAGEVARRAAELAAQTIEEKPDAALLLPAGATPIPMYAELALRKRAGALDFKALHGFQLDEIVGVGAEDTRGFQDFLRQHFFATTGAHAHLLDGRSVDPADEIRRHAAELERCGGADLALLGIGPNGHIAFNEPGTEREAGARVVELASRTREGMARHFVGETLPTHGITLGVREIFAAKRIVLLATGSSKAEVLRRLVEEPATTGLPASLLSEHEDFLVLCDRAAAAALPAS